MRRTHMDPLTVRRFLPANRGPAAGEYERVRSLRVQNGKFQIAVVRCRFYGLPFLHLSKLEHQ